MTTKSIILDKIPECEHIWVIMMDGEIHSSWEHMEDANLIFVTMKICAPNTEIVVKPCVLNPTQLKKGYIKALREGLNASQGRLKEDIKEAIKVAVPGMLDEILGEEK